MRRVEFEGSFNFRDLGGWRTGDGREVRWGRLFRADSVHLLTDADVERAVGEVGIRTMVDLRSTAEIEAGGVGALAQRVADRQHLPVTSRGPVPIDAPRAVANPDRSPTRMFEQYAAMLEVSGAVIARAVERLAGADALPGVFFCAAGKDRTGVLAAVVLGALGVRDDDIIEDYVLTGASMEQLIGRFASIAAAPDLYRSYPPSHFAPYAETMDRLLAHVRERYGSFAAYLRANGVSAATLDRLAAQLVG
ncbi:tyrosine-protein phosphatase [Nocardioides speluncae]|uniref:tyrosine-protein phosphatase n=1 Tax=Nocardioides speluncae TaxID=2670337 RepID=UPI000D69F0FD|nr:tyrosine-protein phosphatase [Nocardioides speluncae]